MINLRESGYDIFSPQRQIAGTQKAGKTSISRKPKAGYGGYAEDEEMGFGNEQTAQFQGAQQASNTPTYEGYASLFGGGGAETPASTGVQQPQQWTDANAMLGQIGQNPWFSQAANYYNQFAQNGQPTDLTAAYQSAKGVAQQDISDAIKQAAEQYGAGSLGKRYGSVMGRSANEIATRRMGELGQSFTQQTAAAQEAAKARQLQGMSGLLNAGSAYGANQLGAAQGKMGLGNYMTQYPLQLAQSAYNMGNGLYGVSQNQAGNLSQNWQNQQAYSNPWLNYMMQMGTFTPNMAYPQYSQSTMGGIFDMLGSAAIGASGLGWKPFGG